MNYTLLAIESLWLAAGLGLLSFFLMCVVEGLVLLLFKINRFGRCLRDSIMANIGTLLLNILLFLILNKVEFEGISEFTEVCFLFLISAFFESWIIRLLNGQVKWSRILAASFIMNLLSFAGGWMVYTTFIFPS
jgi:hypothetical protein